MTSEEVLAQLPNGFHDAVLKELHVEFAKQEVRLPFDFLVGVPHAATEEGREAMRPGVLRLTGVTSMLIEPPTRGAEFAMDDGVYVNGKFGVYSGEPAPPDDGLVRLWFYVTTWDSRMMFTAKGCELEWEG
jgi:hypothetical protein